MSSRGRCRARAAKGQVQARLAIHVGAGRVVGWLEYDFPGRERRAWLCARERDLRTGTVDGPVECDEQDDVCCVLIPAGGGNVGRGCLRGAPQEAVAWQARICVAMGACMRLQRNPP